MKIESRHPESAPVCLGCGYNLHGLPRLRCPECGREIDSRDELEAARWLAGNNEDDRAVHKKEKRAMLLGWVLMGLGVVLNLWCATSPHKSIACIHFLLLAFALLATMLILRARYIQQGLTGRLVGVLGGLWFLAGALAWVLV